MSLTEDLEAVEVDPEIIELRRANYSLQRKLEEHKRRRVEYTTVLREAAHDALAGLEVGPVAPPQADKRKKTTETAISILSDFQLGKVTPSYSSDVCAQRVHEYGDKVIKLANIQRADHPVKELRVYLLGDIVEGELIFPGQAHLVDASLFTQVMVTGPQILADYLRKMVANFEKVHVVGVIGNHGALGGRARRDMHPESNADAFLYEVTRQILRDEKRITWAPNWTPGERHWYAIDQVGEYRFMLFHGDQVKGHGGVPWYGFDRKIKGWDMLFTHVYREQGFHYAVSGHFHTPFREYVNGVTHWGNGSTESHNTYAAEQLASAGEPGQWLLFCHPENGVTAEYLVKMQ